MKYHPHLLNSAGQALDGIFFENRHADKSIEYYLKNNKKWGSRDRKFFAELVYDCVRWWRYYWYLIGLEPQPEHQDILWVSLWKRKNPITEEVRQSTLEQWQKKDESLHDPAIRNAYPDWLYTHLQNELKEQWPDLASMLNSPNKLVLRVNTLKINRETLIGKLNGAGIACKALMGSSTAILVPERVNIFATEMFKEGLFEVQDGSSQEVGPFLDIQPNLRVVDACSGAGGKTLHIADLLKNKGKVIAMDIHQWKLDQLKLRARRNQYFNIEMKCIESQKVIKRLKDTADRLLLDVPCSGLGVLRRNPDTKWKITPESLQELQILQAKLLDDYSDMLKVGGKMVYSTCSILPSENQEQVSKFLARNPRFYLLKESQIFPMADGYDGFYMALLEKK